MSSIERLEIGGRLLLWVVLSGVLVVAVGSEVAETHRKELAELQSKLDKALGPPESKLLSLKSFGPVLRSFDLRNARGNAWFTNVSPRSGVTCVEGKLSNRDGRSAVSLPGCAEVKPYSTTHIEVTFAGGEVMKLCPEGQDACDLDLTDARPTSAPAPAAAAAPVPPKPATAP